MKNNPCPSDANIKRLIDSGKVNEPIDCVTSDFGTSELVLGEWKNKIVKYYELYQLVQRKKHYNGLANIFVPETLRAVETVVAKLYQMIFSQPDWFEYCGRDDNGDEGSAIALNHLTMYQVEENNFKARVMDSLRQMVITGLTVRKIMWDYQEVNRTVGMQDGKPKKVPDTIKDTWTFEPVDLLSFHISDIGVPYNDLQKAEWIGEQTNVKKDYVKKRIARGWFSELMQDELYKDDSAKTKPQSSRASEARDSRLSSGGFTNLDLIKKNECELKEKWGLVKAGWVMSEAELLEEGLDSEDMVEGVIIIGNDCAVLKLEKNPFWHNQKPYVACPYIPKEFELPGMGAAQIGESLQEEINDTRNQTLDNKTLILATMWLKSRTSGIKNDQLTIRPNGVIVTNDMNGLVPLRPPVVAGIGTNMENVAKNDLRESVGASSNLQGIAQSGVGTATESTIINRESMGRLLLTAGLYGELVLKQTLIFAEYNNYQFYDHVKVLRIVGPVGIKFRKMDPTEIGGGHKDVIIKLSLDATENPSIMRQQLMNFFTIIQGIPPQMLPMYWKILDKLYGQFFYGHSLDEILPNPQGKDPKTVLTPEEERDMAIAEQPVLASEGQDHEQYLKYHIAEFKQLAHALSAMSYEIYKKLIMSHQEMLQHEIQIAHAQLIMQQQAMAQQEQGGKSGNMINRGQTQNTSPHNQTAAPSVDSLRQGIGG